jgi:hypothetical protein
MRVWSWWRWTGPTGAPGDVMARPTPWTRSRPHGRCSRVRPPGPRRPRTAMSSRSGCCGWRIARRSRHARKAANQQPHAGGHRALELREQLRGLRLRELVARCARPRPGEVPDGPIAITKYTLRRLARRFQQLDAEAGELKAQMRRLIQRLAPTLLGRCRSCLGVGARLARTW